MRYVRICRDAIMCATRRVVPQHMMRLQIDASQRQILQFVTVDQLNGALVILACYNSLPLIRLRFFRNGRQYLIADNTRRNA